MTYCQHQSLNLAKICQNLPKLLISNHDNYEHIFARQHESVC